MSKIYRAVLRGKQLDADCKTAKTTTGEYGKDDNRVFCYGLCNPYIDSTKPLDKCAVCGAFVSNAKLKEL